MEVLLRIFLKSLKNKKSIKDFGNTFLYNFLTKTLQL